MKSQKHTPKYTMRIETHTQRERERAREIHTTTAVNLLTSRRIYKQIYRAFCHLEGLCYDLCNVLVCFFLFQSPILFIAPLLTAK